MINLQFINPFSDGAIVAQQPKSDPIESHAYLCASGYIFQRIQPVLEWLLACCGYVKGKNVRERFHVTIVSFKLHAVNVN